MNTWIALFRGINVGGKNRVPMAALRSMFESVGCKAVRTYIQSGNVVFESRFRSKRELTRRISDATGEQFGFYPDVILLNKDEFAIAVATNPFADAISAPKTMHFFFLADSPVDFDSREMAKIAIESERYELIGDIFYLHAPDGFGTSKLAANIERRLGVAATARNYSTIANIVTLIESQ
ncbi:DUF1697 domain-containing protein [Rhodopirellula bahusiensis]|uniref:DUF1697 domain-containing protein n=1 Tax=Rhodopirellula bahusiensis TaxID=2014065 RepID=A0A2G1W4T0_9BACT|nr:DUF1697 domain-containing protein [Rhodopirellula bahusiensis]PHQ34054.1 hypothetical protein CEE69_17315 [Rhodopirellula bahusiensis]